MPRRLAATLAFVLAACGKDAEKPGDPEPPPVPKRFETKSSDPVVSRLQAFVEERGIDVGRADWKTRVPQPPWPDFPPGRSYVWRLETDQGTMRFRLFPAVAPKHVASTIYLTLLGFYDGTTFHRVISGFMAQGGCPLGTGEGGPAYQYGAEIHPGVRHDARGLLSTANKGPGTDGSQFFVLFGPSRGLDGKHTIFGDLKDGEETLARIEALGGPPRRDQSAPPKRPIRLLRATIESD